jgi:drug/metabolite transporter (DMT)-like permease
MSATGEPNTTLSAASIALALVTVSLNSAAQLMLRGAALRGATPSEPLSLLKSPLFIGACCAYGLSVLTWLAVLKRVPLGLALPFSALMYVAAPIAARIIFGDPLTWRMAGGAILVVSGVLLVAAR